GVYQKALEDCENTLKLNENNYRALYRKTQALNELGKHKEAYDCIAKFSFAVPQDENVVKLTQELAQKLGLRIRKAYIRARHDMDTVGLTEIGNSVNSSQVSINGTSGIDDIESGSPLDLPRLPVPATLSAPASEVSAPISSVPVSIQQSQTDPPLLKTPLGDGVSLSVPETAEEFPDEEIIGAELDTLLDSIGETNDFPMTTVAGTVPTNLPNDVSRLLAVFPTGAPVLPSAVKGNIGPKVSLPSAYPMLPVQKMDALDSIGPNTIINSLDSLDLLPGTESRPDIASKEDCKYGDQCTFAYCQEEIDVWTLERKGTINRELLFDPLGGDTRRSLTVAKLLKEHLGRFMFLCEECFDSKPRLISKKVKDNALICSNPETKHIFEENK
ncbi:hypothetical protein scyTo_0019908, partial [Scyliorhinus torazame]|nr:hypothetical protein [Scyliorhinus torazame]